MEIGGPKGVEKGAVGALSAAELISALGTRARARALAVVPLFTAVVAGTTWMAIVFAAIVLRHRYVDVVIDAAAA